MLLSQYFICFIIYGFLGWVYESLYYTVQFKKPVNTGFLHVCFCPIYGFACVGNAVMFKNTDNPAVIFITSMLAISIFEYFSSWLLENLFGKRWWDYNEWPLNLNGRISLFSSLAFGVLSTLQIRLIQPSVYDFITRLSERTAYAVILLFIMIITADILITLKDMDKDEDKLWFVEHEPPALKHANEVLMDKVQGISEKYADVKDRIIDRINR